MERSWPDPFSRMALGHEFQGGLRLSRRAAIVRRYVSATRIREVLAQHTLIEVRDASGCQLEAYTKPDSCLPPDMNEERPTS